MQYPEAETIHLVMDNLNTHRREDRLRHHARELGFNIVPGESVPQESSELVS